MNKLLCYRIGVIFTLYIGFAFYNLTRKSISFMLPHFNSNTHSNSSSSLNITKNDIGIIISSHNLAYAISKFIFGILSDVISCRILFGSGLFLSGLLNIGLQKEIKVYNLYTFSFLIGLTQGPAWPTCAKIVRNWLPKAQFGTWWAAISTAANVAGMLGPLAATWVALKYHWSIGFMILGCICMSVGYLCIIILRNKPSDVGFQDMPDEDEIFYEEEKNKLHNEEPEPSDEDEEEEEENTMSSRFQQTKQMLKYPFFVSICLAYFLVQMVKTLFSDLSQVYLIKVIKVDPYKASYFLSSFEFAGIFGSIFVGMLSDCIFHYKNNSKETNTKTKETPINIRFILICINFFCLTVCMHLFNFHVKVGISDYFLMSISMTAGFLCYGSITLLGVMAMEFTTNEYSGTSHAIASLSANFGAICAGLPFSLMSKAYSWNFSFKIVEYFACFVLFVLLIFRNATKFFVPVSLVRKNQ